jgi:hypothetical protein
MQLTVIWVIGGAVVAAVAGLFLSSRSRGPVDLGSVSTSWTTEHNAADRGGDRSNG